MQTVIAHESLLSLGGYESIYATAASAFSLCYHRIGVFVNPTCDGIRGSVGAGDRMGQRRRQLQAVDGRYLIEALRGCWRRRSRQASRRSPLVNEVTFPTHIGRPLCIRRRPRMPVSLSKQGDIPGAYWAALTHPATTQDIVSRIFAGVHMLSHVVGTANRADIRRLRQLEADNVLLSGKCGAPATPAARRFCRA